MNEMERFSPSDAEQMDCTQMETMNVGPSKHMPRININGQTRTRNI